MWTQIPEENKDEPPIQMEILHNDRQIIYYDFMIPAPSGLQQIERPQFCTTINEKACSF